MIRSPKLDSFLAHRLASNEQSRVGRGRLGAAPPEFPILVKVDRSGFDPKMITGLRIVADFGTILAGLATEVAIKELLEDDAVLSLEAGREGLVEKVASFEFVKGTEIHRPPISETGLWSIVAIIDSGIDVFHETFLDAEGKTRIIAIWDQTNSVGLTPKGYGYSAIFDFGTLHRAEDIDKYIIARELPPGLTRNPDGHGTHVASIAAGRAVGEFSGGMAPDARIIVVIPKLNPEPGMTTSVGNSIWHAAALPFIQEVSQKFDLPVVVNASFGMNAGAHDGSSILEGAFDAFTSNGRRAGCCIVKSAGNERNRNIHASIYMLPGVTEQLTWLSTHEHYSTDNVELWFPSEDIYRFRLCTPSGQVSDWVDKSNSEVAVISTNEAFGFGITLDRFFIDNGDTRLLITVYPGKFAKIPAGNFTLEIVGERIVGSGRIDAWIERDDGRPVSFTTHCSNEMTLSVPATAHTVISVASISHLDGVRSSAFSSCGLSRDGRRKPDISAPGEMIQAAASGTDRDTSLMDGTSMAAPHVAGAIALAMSACKREKKRMPNAMQTAAALRGSAQNFSGRHTTTFGYGVLDARALFDTLTENAPANPAT